MKYNTNEVVEFLYEHGGYLKKGTGSIRKVKHGGLFTATKYLIETTKVSVHVDKLGRKEKDRTDIYIWVKEDDVVTSIGKISRQ